MSAVHLGRDLRVLLGPPGFGAHDAASLDVRPVERPSRQRRAPRSIRRPEPSASPELQGWKPEPNGAREVTDLEPIEGREAVAQALVLRLLTPVGSLAELGHAEYGSRLGDLIGRRKTTALRGLCRAFILDAVRREPRVDDRPLAITFDPGQETASSFVVEISVRTVSTGEVVDVALEVGL